MGTTPPITTNNLKRPAHKIRPDQTTNTSTIKDDNSTQRQFTALLQKSYYCLDALRISQSAPAKSAMKSRAPIRIATMLIATCA